jgi:hypothetical protein
LSTLESRHAQLGLYLWLAQRLNGDADDPWPFIDVKAAEAASHSIVDLLEAELTRGSDAALNDHRRDHHRGRKKGSSERAINAS